VGSAAYPFSVPDTTTILLVDDEESIQKLLTFPLVKEGYRVVQARDGAEALERFAAEPVDLVVLDLMLPKLDGLEVCRRMRAQSSVPIIMLTARDDEIDKVIGLELGADDYITKPFSIREFRSRVRAILRRAQLPPAAGRMSADMRGEVTMISSAPSASKSVRSICTVSGTAATSAARVSARIRLRQSSVRRCGAYKPPKTPCQKASLHWARRTCS